MNKFGYYYRTFPKINFHNLKSIPLSDLCDSSPCKNGGECNSENNKWECICTLPFYGVTCENKKNPCQNAKCLNGGTCVQTSDFSDYECLCLNGFKGFLCETSTTTSTTTKTTSTTTKPEITGMLIQLFGLISL